jgi:hypothetical protein
VGEIPTIADMELSEKIDELVCSIIPPSDVPIIQ